MDGLLSRLTRPPGARSVPGRNGYPGFFCTTPAWRYRASPELRRKGSPGLRILRGEPLPLPQEEPYTLEPWRGVEAAGAGTDAPFLRFGFLPEFGRSVNLAELRREPGAAAFRASEARTGYRVELPETVEAVRAFVLEVWQDRPLMVATNAVVISEDGSGTAWLSEAELRILSPDTPLLLPEWLEGLESAQAFVRQLNAYRELPGPFRDRYARFRAPGLQLLADLGDAGVLAELDAQGWRYAPGWGLRPPNAPADPVPDEGRGIVRTCVSRQVAPRYWRSLGLPDPPPVPSGWEPCYVRFGDPPEDGVHSVCRGHRFRERGMSVFAGWRIPEGGYVVDLQQSDVLADWYARRLRTAKAHVVEGTLVGQGVGYEPLLKPVTRYEPLPAGATVETWPPWEQLTPYHETTMDSPPRMGMEQHVIADVSYLWECLNDVRPAHRPQAQRLTGPMRERRGVEAWATEHAVRSQIHGPDHWRRVRDNGEALARETPGADPLVVGLFATLHDTQRLDDGRDPHHGARAARLASVLAAHGLLGSVTADQLDTLTRALRDHAKGKTSCDPTVGCCWDADRLDLVRLGRRINPALLSTDAALRRAR